MLAISRVRELLLELLFPDQCGGCGRLGHLLCAGCRSRLAFYTGRIRTLPALDSIRVVYVYQSPLREAIHQLKYRRRVRVAQPLGELLGAIASDHVAHGEALIPVPMHASRKAERGFNQAEVIAVSAAQAMNKPCLSSGLARVRATDQQVHLNAQQRQENMRGAFAWLPKTAPPACVILVDDVLTTGATMDACARALREAGCREVHGLALARSRPDLA